MPCRTVGDRAVPLGCRSACGRGAVMARCAGDFGGDGAGMVRCYIQLLVSICSLHHQHIMENTVLHEMQSWLQHHLLLFSSLLLLLLLLLYHSWKRHPSYGANPGLPLFPILGSLPSLIINRHRFYDWSVDVLKRTPALTATTAIGTEVDIVTANPANVEHILKTRFESYTKGDVFHERFFDLLGDGIFNVDGAAWKFQRKVASYEFSSSSLRDFVVDTAGAAIRHRLLPLLQRTCDEGSPLDLQNLMSRFSFLTICQLTLGGQLSALDIAQDNVDLVHGGCDFVQAFDTAIRLSANRFLTPGWLWKAKKALRIGSEKKLLDAMDVLNRVVMSIIERKKSLLEKGGEDTEANDLLSRFINMKRSSSSNALGIYEGARKASEDKQGETLSDSLLRDIAISFLLAGRDAVASGVTFFMWLLTQHPRVEEAVYEEVSRISSARSRENGTFTIDEVRKMNYLHAALTESMRLYPPTPADCKYAMEDDTLPNGTRIHKGYRVSYNIYVMGRVEELWGEDCLEFKPERWLKVGVFVAESPYKYAVFQAGPRICLGKDFAYIQMKLIAAALIQGFEFKVCPQHKLHYDFGINLKMTHGLPVTVHKRRPSPSPPQ